MALPRQDPPSSLIDSAARQLEASWGPLADRLEMLEESTRRVALWLIVAEAVALFEYRLDQKIDGLKLLTFGVDSLDDDPSLRVTGYVLPQALEDNRRRVLGPLYLTSQDFDVVDVTIEPWDLALHMPLNLRYATLGCWVKHARGEGIVTVRHAVGRGHVHLDDGSVQPVLWYAPECLDAAVAAAPAGHALWTLPAKVPAVKDAVEVIAKGGTQRRRVAEVGQTYGTTTAAIPHGFLLDQPLQPGDSGSLVRLAGGGAALGLYVGSLATSTGARGFCQGLHQLDVLFTKAGHSSGLYEE